jgi:putative transcriptional regulator
MHGIKLSACTLFLLTAGILGFAASAPHQAAPDAPAAETLEPAAGRFLVASRNMHDPHFTRTVIYLLQHDDDGSLGLIVNRPLSVTLAEALPHLELEQLGRYRMSYGGPVSRQNVIMLLRAIDNTGQALHIHDDIYASNDPELLQQLNRMRKPANEMRLFAGHAGWQPGQLNRELRRNDWYVSAGNVDALFAVDTDSLWQHLIDRLDPEGIYVRHLPLGQQSAGL